VVPIRVRRHPTDPAAEAAARETGLHLAFRQFRDYLHKIKYSPEGGGRGPDDNYKFAELVEIAKEAA
jgi:hypothetical protein